MGVSYCFVIECYVDFAWENFELLRKTRLKEQGRRLIFDKKKPFPMFIVTRHVNLQFTP
jgi:hypothetical protein